MTSPRLSVPLLKDGCLTRMLNWTGNKGSESSIGVIGGLRTAQTRISPRHYEPL
jgi:hypothetical protein